MPAPAEIFLIHKKPVYVRLLSLANIKNGFRDRFSTELTFTLKHPEGIAKN